MSYQLENNETLSFGLKRIVLELIDRSVFNLAKGNGSFNDDIHDTRKNFKKLRTVLRLIRSDIGENGYRLENLFYRDAGKTLSDLRDSTVLIATFDKLLKSSETEMSNFDFSVFRDFLVEKHKTIRLAKSKKSALINPLSTDLILARSRVFDWPLSGDDFKIIKKYVSNGNGTRRVLEYLDPWIDLFKVDLKSFNDRSYRRLGGRLAPILDTIGRLRAMGKWVEIVTLLVPGFKDGPDELKGLVDFIASVSVDVPWHVTAFHQDYRMIEPANTSAGDLLRAVEIGQAAGLRFVYAGNIPGRVKGLENTRCPACRETVVERVGYRILRYHLTPEGNCPACGATIPGRWAAAFHGQIACSSLLEITGLLSTLNLLNNLNT